MRTDVRILRGSHAGRAGWISGTLEDRAARDITRAIVKFADAPAEVLATSTLEVVKQLALFQASPVQERLSTVIGLPVTIARSDRV